MPTTNYAAREIHCKIVYVGPGRSGKTTNLHRIAERVPPASRGQLLTMGATEDGIGSFDLLPIDLGDLQGFRTRFQLHTVPGAVVFTEARARILSGVDGLVFVADSDPDRLDATLVAHDELCDHLTAQGRAHHQIPLVLQLNKRDLISQLPRPELERALEPAPDAGGSPFRRASVQEAIASDGIGVLETLKAITQAVVEDLMAHGVP